MIYEKRLIKFKKEEYKVASTTKHRMFVFILLTPSIMFSVYSIFISYIFLMLSFQSKNLEVGIISSLLMPVFMLLIIPLTMFWGFVIAFIEESIIKNKNIKPVAINVLEFFYNLEFIISIAISIVFIILLLSGYFF